MSLKTIIVGIVMKRAVAGVGTAASGFGGLISMKVLLGMFTGVALVMGIIIWKQGHDLGTVRGQVTAIRGVVAEAAGIPVENLKDGQIANVIRTIAVDRDTARKEAKSFKAVAATQSASVKRLGVETIQARAKAVTNLQRVATITVERDRWVSEARRNANRTQHLTEQLELKQVEDVQDALYNLGF